MCASVLPEEPSCALLCIIPVNVKLYINICIHDASGSILLSIVANILLDGSLCILEDTRYNLAICTSTPDATSTRVYNLWTMAQVIAYGSSGQGNGRITMCGCIAGTELASEQFQSLSQPGHWCTISSALCGLR